MQFTDIVTETDRPAIVADAYGRVVRINAAFTRDYGWTEEDLVAQPLTKIIPEALRDAHQMGFSRFQATGAPTLLGQDLELEITKADNQTVIATHQHHRRRIGRSSPFRGPDNPALSGRTPVDPNRDQLVAELRAVMGRMEAALGVIEEAIGFFDAQGRLKWCNEVFVRPHGQAAHPAVDQARDRVTPLGAHRAGRYRSRPTR